MSPQLRHCYSLLNPPCRQSFCSLAARVQLERCLQDPVAHDSNRRAHECELGSSTQ